MDVANEAVRIEIVKVDGLNDAPICALTIREQESTRLALSHTAAVAELHKDLAPEI